MNILSRLFCCFALLELALIGLLPARSDADDRLARLVPCDIGLCLESHNLAENLQQLAQGELGSRLVQFPPLTKWLNANRQLATRIHKELGLATPELIPGLLGRDSLLAIWPAPTNNRQAGKALLLVEAEDEAFLQRVIDGLQAAHHRAGKRIETRQIELGVRSHLAIVLQPAGGKPAVYLSAVGRLGILANDLEILSQVLQRSGISTVRGDSLADLPAYQSAMSRITAESTLRLFINPRAWDKLILASGRASTDNDDHRGGRAVKQAIVESWQATNYCVAAIAPGKDLRCEAFMDWNHDQLPVPVRDASDSFIGHGAFFQHIPRGALVAAGGHLDIGGLVRRFAPQVLATAAQSGGRAAPPGEALGWLAVLTVLSGLGPNAGMALVPSPPVAAGAPDAGLEPAAPLAWLISLDTQELHPGEDKISLGEALDPLLRTALELAAAGTGGVDGQPSARVTVSTVDGSKVVAVQGPGPHRTSQQLAYTFDRNLFFGGTSAAAVVQALQMPASESLAQSPQLNEALGSQDHKPSQVIYLNLKALRSWIESTPAAVEFLAARKGLDSKTLQRSRKELLTLLQLADMVITTATVEPSGIALQVKVTAGRP